MRRDVLRGTAAAGLTLASVPGSAQRDGVLVGPRSSFRDSVPADEIEREAAIAYHQQLVAAQRANLLALPTHPQVIRLVYIAARLRPFAIGWNERAARWQWEVNLIGSKQVNAFCMPGGKIVFFWGLLTRLALGDDEIAMIMGHEMTHALREHARAQIGKRMATRDAIGLLSSLFGLRDTGRRIAGVGGQLLSLKYSRDDETEADLIGLEIAARAGYDPGAALTLWRKMAALAQGMPPAFLSDHPSNPDRLKVIAANIPRVQHLYDRAPKPDRRFAPPPPKAV